MTPYGFIKATAAYDSLSPTGDDFPRPAFSAADTGPNNNPEFHMKARATRIGSRFEWPDVSKNITITGQIEADFEGNYSRADNRNVSSIRSNALQLRLAYGRIDWNVRPNTDVFFEAGQDWTIFGSSALMNLFETTFYGAYWGNLYERDPQMRVGFVQKLGGSRNFKLSPEFAIMMPAAGIPPADAVTSACTTTSGLSHDLHQHRRQRARQPVGIRRTPRCRLGKTRDRIQGGTAIPTRQGSRRRSRTDSLERLLHRASGNRTGFRRTAGSGQGCGPASFTRLPSREVMTPPATDMAINWQSHFQPVGLRSWRVATREPICDSSSLARRCPTTTRREA